MPAFDPISRLLRLPKQSFFLLGPRGTGKSTWLTQNLHSSRSFDLLDEALCHKLSGNPHLLESLVGKAEAGTWVVLDEVQRIPSILNEVHRLIEKHRWNFALCGSSARKLKRGGANLLGGRALTLPMEGFSWAELGPAFDLATELDWGTLPLVLAPGVDMVGTLAAYVHSYLREELIAEAILRKAQPFTRFLLVAGNLNAQAVNLSNVSREAQVGRSSVEAYFRILEDTLLAHWLPAWRPGFKVRETAHPKFYWFDPGVARAAAGLLHDPVDRLWQGKALEALVFHELRVYNQSSSRHRSFHYYRTPAGLEIDFLIETCPRRLGKPIEAVAIEVKLGDHWKPEWERPLRSLAATEGLKLERQIIVYTGERPLHLRGLDILPVEAFFRELHAGEVF